MRPLLFATFVALMPVAAFGKTWTVGGSGADFPLVAPAIAAAADGDTILVRRGVYRENLTIDRRIALIGEGDAVLYGTGVGSIVKVQADGCEIRGLRIEGSGAGETGRMDAAIEIVSNRNRISGNRMRRVFYGVVVSQGSDNEVDGNEIEGFLDQPFGRRGDGVYVYRGARNLIARNRIAGERDGIYLQYAPHGRVVDNVVERSRYGLHVMFSNAATIRGNTFRTSSVGANIMNGRAVELVGNRFERNRGVSSVGLSLKQCDDSLIQDNLVFDNARGLFLDGSSGNRVTRNRLRYNDTALVLFSSAEANVFFENEFDGNWSDVVADGRQSGSTAWSERGRGNRWSGYRGLDLDEDGVGDSAHVVMTPFDRLEAANPAARLFLRTPVAGALALAEGIAPRGEVVTDRSPIVVPHRWQDGSVSLRAASVSLLILALTAALVRVAMREVAACSN
jgi:nitrous oxidase accessory protein